MLPLFTSSQRTAPTIAETTVLLNNGQTLAQAAFGPPLNSSIPSYFDENLIEYEIDRRPENAPRSYALFTIEALTPGKVRWSLVPMQDGREHEWEEGEENRVIAAAVLPLLETLATIGIAEHTRVDDVHSDHS